MTTRHRDFVRVILSQTAKEKQYSGMYHEEQLEQGEWQEELYGAINN